MLAVGDGPLPESLLGRTLDGSKGYLEGMDGKTGVVVERKSERDIKMRDLYLTLDDQEERTLLFGESLELPLEPGEHRLKASNRLYTQEAIFTVREGETVRFEGVNVQKPGVLNAVAFLSGGVMYKPVLKRL